MSNTSNYTNLKNSYLYGRKHRQNNYFLNYKNFENDIDDPIYTGFTLSIDTISSPLFSGDFTDGKGLMGRIEKSIQKKWGEINSNNIYNIQSHIVKEKFNNNVNIGYGLIENVFSDELTYSATEYIYMVDKKVEGNFNNDLEFENTDEVEYIKLREEQKKQEEEERKKQEEEEEKKKEEGSENNTEKPDNEEEKKEEVVEEPSEIDKKKQEILDAIEKLNNMERDPSQDAKDEVINEYKQMLAKLDEINDEINKKKNIAENYNSLLSNIRKDAIDAILDTKDGSISGGDDPEGSIMSKFESLKENMSRDDVILTFPEKEVKNKYDKNAKKNLATKWLNGQNNYNKINTDTKAEILDATIDVQSMISDLVNDRQRLEDKMNMPFDEVKSPDIVEAILGDMNNVLSFRLMAVTLMMTPSEYRRQEMRIEELKQQLKELEEAENPTSTSDVEETENPVTNIEIQNPSSEYTNEYQSVDTDVPQTVLDLVGFTQGMKKLTEFYPYVFLSVSGLDTAYQKYHEVKDPYYGSGDDRITIECLDSLDLRISSTFNKYFNAVYDREFRRERLPVNLRRFNCSIFVHDIRNFRESLSKFNKNIYGINKEGDNPSSKILEMALNYLSVIEFKFFDCEIDPEETGNVFSNVSNESESEALRTNFTFKYGNCVVNFLPFGDLIRNYEGTNTSSQITEVENQGRIEYTFEGKYDSNFDANLQELLQPDIEVKERYSKEYFENLFKIDKEEGPNYRRFWDKSELGNINNDDYNDYIKLDHPTALDNLIQNRYADFFVNNSIGKIQSSSTELDNALHRTILGISASIGEPPTTIADAMGMGDKYSNFNKSWNPEPKGTSKYLGEVDVDANKPLGKTEDLGILGKNNGTESKFSKSNIEQKTIKKPTLVKKIANDNDNSSSEAIEKTTNLGVVFSKGDLKQKNKKPVLVKKLGKVKDLIAEAGVLTEELGSIDVSSKEDGLTEKLGSIDVSSESKGTTDSLGQFNMSSYPTGYTKDLDVVDVASEATGTTDNLGQFDMLSHPTGYTEDLNVVDVASEATGYTENLDVVDVASKPTGITDKLGGLDMSSYPTGYTEDLDVVDVASKPTGTTDNLGQFDMLSHPTGYTEDLDKVDVASEAIGITDNLGQFDMLSHPTGYTEDLDMVDVSSESTGVTDKLGGLDMSANATGYTEDLDMVDVSSESTGVTDKLGGLDMSSHPTGTTDGLGQFDMSSDPTGTTTKLGSLNMSSDPTGTTDNLGQYDMSANPTGKTDNLGKFDMSAESNGTYEDLGQYDMSAESNGTYDDLGKFDMSASSGKPITDLGHFDMSDKSNGTYDNLGQYDLSTKVGDKITDLGQYDLSTKPGENITNLGKYDLSGDSGKQITNLGKYDLSTKPGEKISDLGQYDLSTNTGENINNLGKYDLSAESNGTHENLGKVDLSAKPGDKISDLGQYDLSTKSMGTHEDLGKVNLHSETGETITDLGQYNMDTPKAKQVDDLGKQDLSVKSNGVYKNLGKEDLSTTPGKKISDIGNVDMSSPEPKNTYKNLGKEDLSTTPGKPIQSIGSTDTGSTQSVITGKLGNVNHTEEESSKEKTPEIGKQDSKPKQQGISKFKDLGNVFRN